MIEIIKDKQKMQIIKTILFSIITVLLISAIIKTNIHIKNNDTEEVKISVEKEKRGSYPKTEMVWGTLEIPSLKIKSDIYRGSDELLKYGLLHHNESYFPSDGGTILIAGNNKYLKNLSEIKINDKITINTTYGSYKYKVEKTEIKNSKKLSAELEISSKEEKLIIYTTYPEIKGYKSERFVVYASLVGDNK